MALPYETYEQKFEDARRYQDSENIPWRVLVDDLEGRVHQIYGGLPNPTYVLTTEGRVSFYNMWSHAPSLFRALADLTGPESACVVRGGVDRTPHIMSTLADGWPALTLGLPQSFSDLEQAVPGMARGLRMSYKLKPLLAPVALRAKPLPVTTREMAVGAGIYLGSKMLSSR